MYRMMIVDDEDDERFGIRYLLNKFEFEFCFIEAENGMEALEKLSENPVDILLTDVKMPFLDGLELSKIVREKFPETEIVFFSGYDDFTYVKQALSIQAVDYILKPVNPDEFRKVMEVVTGRLEKRITTDLYNQQFQTVYTLTRLLNQISYEKLKSAYGESKLSFLNQYKRMLLLEFEEDFFGKKVEDIQEINEKLQKEIGLSCELIDLNPAQGILLFRESDKTDSYFREAAKAIHLLLKTEYGVPCFIAISEEIDAPQNIGSIYQKTEKYLEDRFFYKDTCIYPIEREQREEAFHSESINQLMNEMEEDIKFRDIFSLQKNMEIILHKCKNNEFQSYIYTRFVCGNLIKILYQALPEQQNEISKKIEDLYHYNHFAQVEESLEEIMNRVIHKLSFQQDSPKHMICIIEKYIHDHYMDVLSLDILAEKVYLTSHYLSNIFSQEKGIGLNKYIKKVRMDKAEELLRTTNMKIGDICEAVGYTNLSYFCKTFRNEYGVTPEKYRES